MKIFDSHILLIALVMMTSFSLSGQSSPIETWDFQQESWRIGSVNQTKISGVISDYHWNEEGYITLKESPQSGQLVIWNGIPSQLSLTLTFRIQPHQKQQNAALFWTQDYGLDIRLSPNLLSVNTQISTSNGAITKNSSKFPLSGTGIASYGYWADGNWHQLTIVIHASTGRREIFLDGGQDESWMLPAAPQGKICGGDPCVSTIKFGRGGRAGRSFLGDISEISVYNQILRPTPVRARNLSSQNAEEPISILSNKEYPKTSSAESAYSQLSSFPIPRYLPGHSLRRLGNWMNPAYTAGHKLTSNSLTESIHLTAQLQEELVTNWHYYLTLENSLRGRALTSSSPSFAGKFIEMANSHPEWPIAIHTYWAQLKAPDQETGRTKRAYITRKNLEADLYLQNGNGQFISKSGQPSNSPNQFRPDQIGELAKKDGEIQKNTLESILSRLNRPVDIITENGEVPPFPVAVGTYLLDPHTAAVLESLSEVEQENLIAEWKTALRSAYRDEFINHPKLGNSHFSWYGIDGGPYGLDKYRWSRARLAMRPIDGQYYSTPNFYVRWPDNWRRWKGPWRGWEWISITRKVEIQQGDKLFSPFVAAGWDKDSSKNVRPSQWLGLLKCLGVVGAEFFYTGVFHENNVNHFPRPENYIWQAVIPSYAQAVTSRYEDILRNGSLLKDQEGEPITEYSCPDPRVLIVARKHDLRPEYIICGTLQPNSNVVGNIEDEVIATTTIDGYRLTIPVRKQGSVYHLDLSNPSIPIIRQLDGWHEAGHPSWWSENFHIEAENADFVQDCQVLTQGLDNFDLTSFQTVIRASGPDACVKYYFEPRRPGTYKISLLMASDLQDQVAEVLINGSTLGAIKSKTGSTMKWQTSNQLITSVFNASPQLLSVKLDPGCSLDKVLIERISH